MSYTIETKDFFHERTDQEDQRAFGNCHGPARLRNIPRTLGEMGVRINVIADVTRTMADKGRSTKNVERDRTSLIDFWDYVEKGMGVRASVEKYNDMPRTDP